MKIMLILRVVFFSLLALSLLIMIGMIGSSDNELNSKISRFGTPYDSSIFTLYDNKIYASVPSNGDYEVAEADMATFRAFDNFKGYRSQKMAVDKNHVYAGNLIVPNLNPAKTVSLGEGYYTDGQYTYYCGSNSIRNDDLNIVTEVFQMMLYGLNIGSKPQSYLYPIKELPASSKPYYSILDNSLATDGQTVFFEGKELPQANPITLRQLAQVYDDGDKRPSYDYLADDRHVYYKHTLLPLNNNAEIYSFEMEGNSLESYLVDPKSGMVFMHDVAFDNKNAPYNIISPYGAHVYHAMFSAKDGIYYYDREDKKVKRAGDNPFQKTQFKPLSEFVFTDGAKTLFLESERVWSSRKSRPSQSQYTYIKEIEGVDASLWENLGTSKSRFGSVWENADKLYYFDTLGRGQAIENSIYIIANQQTVQTLLQEDLRTGDVKDLIDNKRLIAFKGKSIATASSKYGSNNSILIWLGLLFAAIIPVVGLLQNKFKILKTPFIIKDNKLQMVDLFAKSFVLSEIRQVVFTQHHHLRSGYSGKLQVHLKNGKRSKHYLFSKTIGKDDEMEMRDFIKEQQEELRKHGIDSRF